MFIAHETFSDGLTGRGNQEKGRSKEEKEKSKQLTGEDPIFTVYA